MSHLTANPTSQRPVSSRSNLSFALTASSSSDTEDDAPLPFPSALPRSDFLAPDFDPAEYLSSLSQRHQTLEDLRSDLRERSAAISSELLELVNSNYTSFLSLGDELKGGEERVEDARVGLLGFRRAIEEVREKVRERGAAVGNSSRDLRGVRSEVELGRKILELDERISDLEGRLLVGSLPNGSSVDPDTDESEDEDDQDQDFEQSLVGMSAAKLEVLAAEYVTIEELADAIGRDAPLVRRMEERIARCRSTMLLDLNTAIKEAKKAGSKGHGKVLRLMGIYGRMDAEGDAVKVLTSI